MAHGETDCEAGLIVINAGTMLSGINYTNTNSLPKMNYEIALDAMKLKGDDFFCGLTFPVGDACSVSICGGWGGATTDSQALMTMTLRKMKHRKPSFTTPTNGIASASA